LLVNEAVGFRPLYIQVREELVRHLADGRWQPGAALPSEQELARELGVSQGTARKALDSLTADHILVRRQGRGTFVAEFEESRILFQFFRLYPDSGERLFPTSRVLARTTDRATARERSMLGLEAGAKVLRVERVRYHSEEPILREIISLAADRFPGFPEAREIPNNVYQLYSQRWGATVTKIREKLKAIAASADDSAALKCAKGTPLLQIERVALDINRRPIEFRRSFCLTERMHYASDLS
jgi:GntR family transcriptional regulator